MLDGPDALRLSFQPILDVRASRTAGWEILARFASDPRVPTDQWFAAAYAAGLGIPLETLVLTRVLPAWRLRSPGTFMTVNVTPTALNVPSIERIITAEAPLHGLIIELTEQLVPGMPPDWEAACARLRRLGAMIAIDDIGTGYAELAQILSVRPDIIKLDRLVIAGVDRDPAQRALVRFLGEFGDHLDAWVLAEGVERPGQLAALRELGVPLAQGWLTGRPQAVPMPCPASVTRTPPLADPRFDDERDANPQDDEPRVRPRRQTLAPLVRPAQLSPAAEPVAQQALAHQAFGRLAFTARQKAVAGPLELLCGPRHEPTVLLDRHGRPAAVIFPREDDEPALFADVSLLVSPELTAAEAARRAMARPSHQRFDPLVCIDRSGRVLGVIAVPDLVLALADRE